MGFISALFGIGIHMATITLVNMKNDIVTKFMYSGRWGEAFGWHFAFALLFATLSYLFVYYEPAAAGSGIPEIKRFDFLLSPISSTDREAVISMEYI